MKTKLLLVLLAVCLGVTGCSSAGTMAKKEAVLPTAQQASVPLIPIDNTKDFNGKTLYEYYQLNRDTIGWLKIEGIKTDHVVMLTDDLMYDTDPDGEDPYLYHNFDHEVSSYGELFIDARCYVNQNDLSQNITIYGHHMRDGTMLAGLENYRRQSYYEEHQYVQLDTLWGTYYYRIFAVFQVNLKNASEAAFEFRQPDYEDQADFMTMIDGVQQRAYYDTGVEVKENDKVITLYTCTYPTGNPGVDNARLIVMGRMCTEAEIAAMNQTA